MLHIRWTICQTAICKISVDKIEHIQRIDICGMASTLLNRASNTFDEHYQKSMGFNEIYGTIIKFSLWTHPQSSNTLIYINMLANGFTNGIYSSLFIGALLQWPRPKVSEAPQRFGSMLHAVSIQSNRNDRKMRCNECVYYCLHSE